jgi:hypothetical protein
VPNPYDGPPTSKNSLLYYDLNDSTLHTVVEDFMPPQVGGRSSLLRGYYATTSLIVNESLNKFFWTNVIGRRKDMSLGEYVYDLVATISDFEGKNQISIPLVSDAPRQFVLPSLINATPDSVLLFSDDTNLPFLFNPTTINLNDGSKKVLFNKSDANLISWFNSIENHSFYAVYSCDGDPTCLFKIARYGWNGSVSEVYKMPRLNTPGESDRPNLEIQKVSLDETKLVLGLKREGANLPKTFLLDLPNQKITFLR